MATSIFSKSIFRTATVILVALAALAFAGIAQAEERTPESDVCDANPNAYFGSTIATEEYIDGVVGHDNWQVGQYYLIGQEILENGWILQFWIYIQAVDEHGNYTIVEYYYFPHCDEGLVYGQVNEILVNKFVNPVLEETGLIRSVAFTPFGQSEVVEDVADVKVRDDDDNGYPPDPVEPSNNGANQGVVVEDDPAEENGDGTVIVITENTGDIILVPIPVPVIP